LAFLTALWFCCGAGAQFPEVSEEALAELGSTYGIPQMNGFVFIEGRFIPPPYTVTRKGNGIFINRMQVEQPVPWSGFAAAGTNGAEPPAKKAVDADGDFEAVEAAAKPAPAAPAAPAVPAGEPAAEPDKPKTAQSIDDLFADEAKPAAQAPALQPAAGRTPEDVKAEKDALRANLDRIRKGYEQSLHRGDIFFFGQRHNRVNGNYGTARTLMGVLPKALRHAESPNDLLQRLTQGGVYFIDLGICTELYKNKTTFPLLEERLLKIEEAEAVEAMKRKPANVW